MTDVSYANTVRGRVHVPNYFYAGGYDVMPTALRAAQREIDWGTYTKPGQWNIWGINVRVHSFYVDDFTGLTGRVMLSQGA